jgi:hypothetical protein
MLLIFLLTVPYIVLDYTTPTYKKHFTVKPFLSSSLTHLVFTESLDCIQGHMERLTCPIWVCVSTLCDVYTVTKIT